MNIDFVTIYTDKLDASIAFYTKTLGLEVIDTIDYEAGATLVFLKAENGVMVELVDTGMEVPYCTQSPVALTVKVDSMIETEKFVSSQGVEKEMGPVTLPNGITLMHIADPNGVIINFVQMG